MPTKSKTIALALGSGGARGLAHIGVIRVLERHGWRIDAIAGSSMGALIGGFHAAGRLEAYADWVQELTELNVMRYLDLSWGGAGLLKGQAVMETLREFIGEHYIEELPIPLTVVATDPRARREVWINQGDLFDAIRASIAVPTVFTPHVVQGRPLLDGGILNPVPIAPVMHNRGDLVVAVSLSGPPRKRPRPTPPSEQRRNPSYRKRIDRFIEELQERFGREDRWHKQEEALSLVDAALLSIDAMQAQIAACKLAAYPPDLLIEIPIDTCAVHEFYRATEVIEAGEYWAEKALSGYLAERDA